MLWIDGKKIYRKVINCGALQGDTVKRIPTNIVNIEEVIKITAMTKSTGYNVTTPIPYTSVGGRKKVIYIQDNAIHIYVDAVEEQYDKCFVILEYTKNE